MSLYVVKNLFNVLAACSVEIGDSLGIKSYPETAKWRLTKEGDSWFGQLPQESVRFRSVGQRPLKNNIKI